MIKLNKILTKNPVTFIKQDFCLAFVATLGEL